MQEVHDTQALGRQADPQAQRRCGLMFELSVNLERLLEFLAAQLPAAFRSGSTLNLTRLTELLSFILSHTAGTSGVRAPPGAVGAVSSNSMLCYVRNLPCCCPSPSATPPAPAVRARSLWNRGWRSIALQYFSPALLLAFGFSDTVATGIQNAHNSCLLSFLC